MYPTPMVAVDGLKAVFAIESGGVSATMVNDLAAE
jgi:hypothetical protein